MYYAKDIDTVKIGKDFYNDLWAGIRPNAQSYDLLMVLQSLPQTRRDVGGDGNSAFVNRRQYFSGDDPKTKSKGDIITIDPTPTEHYHPPIDILYKACAQANPQIFATEQAKREKAAKSEEEINAAINAKRDEINAQIAAGGDKEMLTTAFRYFEHHHNLAIQDLHSSVEITLPRLRKAYGLDVLHDVELAFIEAWRREQTQPITALLREAGIEFRGGDDAQHNIELDQNQPDFDTKLGALMDTHRLEIIEHYKDVDFIITKPDGTALDKEQAAKVIAKRAAALEADRAALDAAAQKYGVSTMVEALSRPRTGFGGRSVAGDSASGD